MGFTRIETNLINILLGKHLHYGIKGHQPSAHSHLTGIFSRKPSEYGIYLLFIVPLGKEAVIYPPFAPVKGNSSLFNIYSGDLDIIKF